MINVLILGQGGREHAIAWNLTKSSKIGGVYVCPGNAGTFLEKDIKNVEINLSDHQKIIQFVKDNNIDLTIVGPEVPLVDGIVDRFQEENLRIFGPTKNSAKLEGSKEFAKKFMKKNSIPTANFYTFQNQEEARKHIKDIKLPVVIKADGLAAGKGVFICNDQQEAEAALTNCFMTNNFKSVVIEDFLVGQELSSIYVCNFRGCSYEIGLPWIKDYKSRDEFNSGPNTGGMGAISHPFCYEHKNILFKLHIDIEKILTKTIVAINELNHNKYFGFLYLGLMIDPNNNIKLLEYNCRLGDPETQNIMLYLERKNYNLLDLIENNPRLPLQDFNLGRIDTESDEFCSTIVLAAKGYPEAYKKDFFLDLSDIKETENIKIFHSGTVMYKSKVKSIGGRILSVNVFAESKEKSLSTAYDLIRKIKCYEDEGLTKENNDLVFFREDIGQ